MFEKYKRNLTFPLCLGGVVLLFCCLIFIVKFLDNRIGNTSSVGNENDLNKLGTLGYVVWSPIAPEDSDKSGVMQFDPQLAYKGTNLYYSENKKGGYLFDMQGNTLHTFTDKRLLRNKGNWQLIEPYHNDEFLILIQRKEIFRINQDSKIKDRIAGRFHHDIAVLEDGSLYTLMHEKQDIPQFSSTEPVRNDWLVLIGKDGRIEKKASFAEMVLKNEALFAIISDPTIEKRYDFGKDAWDIFHTNSVELIDQNISDGNHELFKKGNILCSIRHLNLIVVIDVEKQEMVWHWGAQELDLPHHASLLENGHILIFDNGTHRGYSRVLEVNPLNQEIVWEYNADPPESFYSETRGSAQRLPNGNTLIAESDRGRVFEVTSGGTVVWEFFNPETQKIYDIKTGKYQENRATIYRMLRIFDTEKLSKQI
jgi:hypothetical protein